MDGLYGLLSQKGLSTNRLQVVKASWNSRNVWYGMGELPEGMLQPHVAQIIISVF